MSETTWRTPEYACLNCGYVVDAASSVPLDKEPRGPEEGDVTVCLKCSHMMIFKADRTVRAATEDELMEIASDPHVVEILKEIAWLRRHDPSFDEVSSRARFNMRGKRHGS